MWNRVRAPAAISPLFPAMPHSGNSADRVPRYIQATPEEADVCEAFVDALLLLPLVLERTCSYVRYSCKYGDLRAPAGVVQHVAAHGRALRETMEDVEEYCLENGCTVVPRDRTKVDTAVFRKFVRRAVPRILQCTLHMCAQHSLLTACARACRSASGMCSGSDYQHSRDARAAQQEYARRILGGLRYARGVAALTERLGSAAVRALHSHALAAPVLRVAQMLGAVARALQ